MIKAVTGAKDILPWNINSWNHLENIVKDIAGYYNYLEIRTPLFEETQLFQRGIGEATDIVSKEMYTFTDLSGISLTLKPEMTAPVVRAFIEHSLEKRKALHKLFYISPMFRQERPQAGRFRQFHQFGAEAIGSNDPLLDAEIIILAYKILKELGLNDLEIKVNSLGMPEARDNYKILLKEYFTRNIKSLSEESRKRLDTNILRIFDSKNAEDQKVLENAPRLYNHLDDDSLLHFKQVTNYLDIVGINYILDTKLVRGLDYYTNTTFEIVSGSVGAQSALCGGGRYNLLSEHLGGKYTPAVGFAAGMERILLACENENCLTLTPEKIDLYIIRLEKDLTEKVFSFAEGLRQMKLSVEVDYQNRSVKAQMREANKLNSKYSLFIGGEELSERKVVLKEMETGEQETLKLEDLSGIRERIKN